MSSRCMPKKFSVTVPEPIYEILSMLARIRDKSVATLAAQAIEDIANEAIESGVIAKFQELTEEKKEDKSKAFNALDILITKLAEGKQPTTDEISQAAIYTTIDMDDLKAIFKRIQKRGDK